MANTHEYERYHGLALVDGRRVALEAHSQIGLKEMVRSIGYVERTPEEVVEAFEDFEYFHAEVLD